MAIPTLVTFSLVPRALAGSLRKQGIGDAESLGRLNIAAASAALADSAHVSQIRSSVAAERTKWITVLDELTLAHTDSQASFIFSTQADRSPSRGSNAGSGR
jgi:histidinol-phosphate aminotransferase